MALPSWMEGTEVGKESGYDPIFRVKAGSWWPATMVSIGEPYANKPDQFNAKGSLRIRFGFVIDGTAEYLKQTLGLDSVPEDKLHRWYSIGKSVKFPITDDAPPCWDTAADKPAEWTQDAAQIARYRRPIAPIAEMNGAQSLFGVLQQLGAVKGNPEKGKPPTIDWAKAFGARVFVLNGAGDKNMYVDSVRFNHDLNIPDEVRGTLSAQEDTQFLLRAMADFNARHEAGKVLPGEQSPILVARKWPEKKEQAGNGGAQAPKVPVPPYLKVWIGQLFPLFGNDKAQSLIFPVIAAVAEKYGLSARRFSEIDVEEAWMSALIRIVELAMENSIAIPALPESDEAWVEKVSHVITLHSDNVDASAFV